MGARKWVVAITVLLLLLMAGFAVPLPAKASTASELELQTKLTNYFSIKHAHYTLSLREIGGDQHQVGIDENRRIEPASVIKLFWAWAVLKRVDEGTITLNTTLRTGFTWDRCLNLMIKVSDNDCSAWIREGLGNNTLNAQLLASGYPNTQIVLDAYGKYKTKYTTAADTSLLLERLEQGTLLTPLSTLYFRNLLKAQTFRTRITPGVQKGVVVENKGGNLWVTGGWTESDAAIVRGPHSTYVLVIYGRNEAKKAEIAAASKLVYQHTQNASVTVANTFPRRQYTTKWLVWVRKTPNGRGIYQAKKGVLVELYYADRDWVKIKQDGKTAGFVRFSALQLRGAYLWP
jgi:beta-lactamase class A